jgi:hypothetical protein
LGIHAVLNAIKTAPLTSAIAVLGLSAAITHLANAGPLGNELDTAPHLTVLATPSLGPRVLAGAWSAISVTVENSGQPFDGVVCIRCKCGPSRGARFRSAPTRFDRGAVAVEVAFVHTGAPITWLLEISYASDGHRDKGPLFRANVSALLRPLSNRERLVVILGRSSIVPGTTRPSDGPEIIAAPLEVPSMPSLPTAYGAVSAIVVGSVGIGAPTASQAEAFAEYVLGGGTVVFTSFRSLSVVARALPGLRDSLVDRPRIAADGLPDRVQTHLGFGRVVAFAADDGGETWDATASRELLAEFCASPRPRPSIDRGAYENSQDTPFAASATRGRAVAVFGALLGTVALAYVARSRAARVLGFVAVTTALTILMALLYDASDRPAARVLRVSLLSPDGQARVTVETIVFTARRSHSEISIATSTGPAVAVARRRGNLTDLSYESVAASDGGSSIRIDPESRSVIAVRSINVDSPEEGLITRILARGDRLQRTSSTTTPSDSPEALRVAERIASLMGYRGRPVAWELTRGIPQGVGSEGADASPGSLSLSAVVR